MQFQGFLNTQLSWDTKVPAEAVVKPESVDDNDTRGLWKQEHLSFLLFLPTYSLTSSQLPAANKLQEIREFSDNKKELQQNSLVTKLRILHGFFALDLYHKFILKVSSRALYQMYFLKYSVQRKICGNSNCIQYCSQYSPPFPYLKVTEDLWQTLIEYMGNLNLCSYYIMKAYL